MNGTDPWVDVSETHSAAVVFVGDRAYKWKKPVRFDFLDFSTPELREQALRRELSLNRRIAPDVYLGIAEVRDVDGAIEHVLVMRRLPARCRLSALVRVDEVHDDDLRALARLLSAFHGGAARNDEIAAAGSSASIGAHLGADLEELRALPKDTLPLSLVDECARLATRYLSGRDSLFARRIAKGWVCDGHGDLLAEDVFLLPDGPRVLDCLDFSDELRYGDVLADVAFLAMDLEHLGAPELAARFVDLYCEMSGESHPRSLFDYYVAFRALIRAKVSALRFQQGDRDARATAIRLLELARAHLRRSRVTVTLVGGAPGTGKSTVAHGLAARNGWVLLRSDVVRKELAGLDPRAPAGDALDAGLYSHDAIARTYDELLTRARVALQLGESVVIDASWADSARRADVAAMAAATSSDIAELRCDLDDSVADDRLRGRQRAGGDPSDAGPFVAAEIRTRMAPWPSAVVIETSRSREEAVEDAISAVSRATSGRR